MDLERVVAFAVPACEDEQAAQVFGDVVLEEDWYDERALQLVYGARWVARKRPRKRLRLWDNTVGRATSAFARASLAVILCGEWQRHAWRLPFDAYEMRFGGYGTVSRATDILRRYYPERRFDGAFYNISRAPDPVRLAGMRVISDPAIPAGRALLVSGEHSRDLLLSPANRLQLLADMERAGMISVEQIPGLLDIPTEERQRDWSAYMRGDPNAFLREDPPEEVRVASYARLEQRAPGFNLSMFLGVDDHDDTTEK